jgi:hypothetical protein
MMSPATCSQYKYWDLGLAYMIHMCKGALPDYHIIIPRPAYSNSAQHVANTVSLE